MIRKVFSIIMLIVAGFFFYIVGLLGFIAEPSTSAKLGVMLGFALPSVVALFIGLALRKFRRWKRDAGVVLVSAAGLGSFIVVSFVFMLMSEEYRRMMGPDTIAYFRDYVTGGAILLVMAVLGTVLLWQGRIKSEGAGRGDRQEQEIPSF
jgi:fucose 4-O-acetylase-like acetyltransferase